MTRCSSKNLGIAILVGLVTRNTVLGLVESFNEVETNYKQAGLGRATLEISSRISSRISSEYPYEI